MAEMFKRCRGISISGLPVNISTNGSVQRYGTTKPVRPFVFIRCSVKHHRPQAPILAKSSISSLCVLKGPGEETWNLSQRREGQPREGAWETTSNMSKGCPLSVRCPLSLIFLSKGSAFHPPFLAEQNGESRVIGNPRKEGRIFS